MSPGRGAAIPRASADASPAERAQRLGASIYEILLERLVSLEIEPGGRIAVDSLVREFGVSQTPIREALSQLEAQGLVIKTHLVGYRAAPLFPESDFEDLYEVRRLLEPQGAVRACREATTAQLAAIDAHMAEVAQLVRDGSRHSYNVFARADQEFHAMVASAGGNRFLRDTVKSWSLQFHLFRRGYNPAWMEAVVAEHAAIVHGITKRREDCAGDAMRRHIENSHARFRRTMVDEHTPSNARGGSHA